MHDASLANAPEFPNMMRKPVSHLLLALSLAVILPLELAQCGWMGIGKSACSAGMPGACAMAATTAASPGASHACCRAKSANVLAAAKHASGAAQSCVCKLVPAGTLPATLSLGASSTPAFVAVATDRDLTAPVSLNRELLPAPDVGSAPLPAALGAHLLRAPPVSA
jgi:hypothetical protein